MLKKIYYDIHKVPRQLHRYYCCVFTDLKNNALLYFINLSGQAAVGDGIDDDWLVGLGARLLEEFRTYSI